MRRFFSLSLILLLVFILGCTSGTPEAPDNSLKNETNYIVKGIMKYPDYTFSSDPSPLDLRLRSISAFKDLLSVRWSISTAISYNKTGPISDKTFRHDADVTYAGTIYSNASTGLFQFLEFYDFNTGRLNYPGSTEEMKETLGASCADAMIWGVTTVCNSITGPYYPATMVYQNGFLPVGGYTYDYSITNFNLLPTYKIVEQNGTDVILDAYTQVTFGDMFVSTPDNHGMMAISSPVVHYKDDGSIDIEKSYIYIQDQRGGQGSGFYEVKEGGDIIRYSGRTKAKFTFQQLLDKSYLPVTTAEFAGLKPFEPATASISPSCTTVSDLAKATVTSNYPLAVVNVLAIDSSGNQTVIGRKLFNGAGEQGVPREFALGELACLQNFADSMYSQTTYTIKVEVVPSSGQRFIVAEVPAK